MLLQEQEKERHSEDLEEAAEKYDESESWRYEALKYPRRDAFEAGAKWQYQKDRYEFAKLKAKEWMSGYDEGLAKAKEEE